MWSAISRARRRPAGSEAGGTWSLTQEVTSAVAGGAKGHARSSVESQGCNDRPLTASVRTVVQSQRGTGSRTGTTERPMSLLRRPGGAVPGAGRILHVHTMSALLSASDLCTPVSVSFKHFLQTPLTLPRLTKGPSPPALVSKHDPHKKSKGCLTVKQHQRMKEQAQILEEPGRGQGSPPPHTWAKGPEASKP